MIFANILQKDKNKKTETNVHLYNAVPTSLNKSETNVSYGIIAEKTTIIQLFVEKYLKTTRMHNIDFIKGRMIQTTEINIYKGVIAIR